MSLPFWIYKYANKSEPFKTKNNTQTLPKQLQNNFVKVQNTTFSNPKRAKSDPLKCQKCLQLWMQILVSMSCTDLWSGKYLVFWDRKTMLKHFLNSSWTSLKNSRIRLFCSSKLQKITFSNIKCVSNFEWKSQFWRSYIDLWSWKLIQKWTLKTEKNA